MEVIETPLPGLVVLKPVRHGDARGFFSESWNRQRMAAAGLDIDFVQDNHSMSAAKGTLRGLHYQAPPFAQAKLVRCTAGVMLDVAVDIRRGSPNFGEHVTVELSASNGRQLYIPEGFLHGFVTYAPNTEVMYKCSAPYAPEADGAVRWDSCGIDWGLKDPPLLSAKDAKAPNFAEFESPFDWQPTP